MLKTLLAFLLLCFSGLAFADSTLTEREKSRVLDGVFARIRETYIEPGDVPRIEAVIRGTDYRAVQTPQAFAAQLEGDLRKAANDPHFWVTYNPEGIPPLPTGMQRPPETDAQRDERLHVAAVTRNNGFARVAWLEGNVGVIEMSSVYPADEMVESAAAAMAFVKETSALILDLRQVRGGDPTGVTRLLSYFVEGRVHAFDLAARKSEDSVQYFTDPTVRGPRYAAQKPVFVLTSGTTFSGGEAMIDAMRTWRHARVVGERTRGGANAALPTKATDHFVVVVPFMKTVNAATGKNWNGVGIEPDVSVPADEAQDEAYGLALQAIAETTKSAAFREQLRTLLQKLKPNPKQ